MTPSARNAGGCGETRYCRTSPPDRDHLRDAGNAEQPRPDREVGDLAQLHRRGAVAGHRDQQDLPHDRADRPHLRQDVGRQLIAHQGEPFGDQLAVAVDVGAPVELDIDDRQADAGDRAHARDARHAVHLRLDREADEQLDLGRREPFRLGHDGDGRLVEVGKHVDRQARDA